MSASRSIEVIPLGTGNYCTTRRYNTSLVLRAGDQWVLIDCPEPFFRMCAEASRELGISIDPALIDNILLTHLHGDHSNGLESLGFWRKFSTPRKVTPIIHTSKEAAGALWKKLEPAMGEATVPPEDKHESYRLSDYFDVRSFSIGSTVEICGIKFETRRTRHSIPCFGFRATVDGHSFGYSCDTSYDPELIAFLEPCDLIFHECDTGMHTPLEMLEALPGPIREKMRLIHVNDRFNGSAKIEVAEAGKIYRV